MTNTWLEEESGERDAAATSGKSPKACTYSTRSPAFTSAAAFSKWKETGAKRGLCAPTAFLGGASSYQLCPDFNSKGQRLVPSVCLAKGWSVCLSVSARVPAFRGQRQDSASQSLGRSASSCHPFAHPQKHPSIPGLLTPLAVSAAKTWAWLRTPVAFSKTPQ